MKLIDIELSQLKEASWNSNRMELEDLARLKKSIERYGLVQNLVVRPIGTDAFEVLSGNQRLSILKEMAISPVSCVVANLDDVHARLLSQALNHIHGEDDLGLRAEVLRKVLETVSEQEILDILPETVGSLNSLAALRQENITAYLQNWQQAQTAKLKHLQFQLIPKQVEIVEEAIARILPKANQSKGESPNVRGTAIFLLCKYYLENQKHD
jgi:ParB family chromosome partitioning protein